MATLNVLIDTTSNQLIASLSSSQIVDAGSLPLTYPDQPSINIYLLDRLLNTQPGVWPFRIIPTTGLQLFVELTNGLVDSDRTVYTQQIVWTPVADSSGVGAYFNALLPLNTATVKTLVQTTAPRTAAAYLKIAYVQNGVQTDVLSRQVNIGIGVGTTAVVVPAGQTAISLEVAMALFFPLNPANGQALNLKSMAGVPAVVFASDNPDGSISVQGSQVN